MGSWKDKEGDTGAAGSGYAGDGVSLTRGDSGFSRENDSVRDGDSTTLSLLAGRANGLVGRSEPWFS